MNKKEEQFVINRTLDFIVQNIESENDYKILKSSLEDYREMGYSTKEFEIKFETYLEMLERVYDENDLDFTWTK